MSLFNNIFGGGDSGSLGSWSVATSGTSSIILNATYDNNSFVAVCRGSLRSVDGISWTLTETATAYPSGFYGLAYGAGVWVVGTMVSATNSHRIFTSTNNGTTWTGRTSPFAGDDYVRSIAYGNGVFVAYGGLSTYKLATSTNGTTWTNRTLPTGLTSNDEATVSFANGKFFMTNTYPKAYISSNGTSWTVLPELIPSYVNVVYGNGTYVMLGNGSAFGVATSTNGTTWVKHPNAIKNAGITTNVTMYDITYADGLFVAVGASGTVLTSEDGITWTKKTSSNFGNTTFYSVCYGNSKFVIAGSGGKILYSTL